MVTPKFNFITLHTWSALKMSIYGYTLVVSTQWIFTFTEIWFLCRVWKFKSVSSITSKYFVLKPLQVTRYVGLYASLRFMAGYFLE